MKNFLFQKAKEQKIGLNYKEMIKPLKKPKPCREIKYTPLPVKCVA